jgi:hypothetical protein
MHLEYALGQVDAVDNRCIAHGAFLSEGWLHDQFIGRAMTLGYRASIVLLQRLQHRFNLERGRRPFHFFQTMEPIQNPG